MSLGLFRSDYFYCESNRGLKQVEFNTIASSFGGLTSQLVGAHRSVSQQESTPPFFFLLTKTLFYLQIHTGRVGSQC